MDWTFLEVVNLLGLNASEINDANIQAVSTDTRTLQPGDLFIALQGDQFDAHGFLDQAFQKGASGAIVRKMPESFPYIDRCLCVDDTLKALQTLAGKYRERFSIPVIAITGSNGKTTTKEMTAAVLGTTMNVAKSPGNLNNHIGVPLSILDWKSETEAAVVEMGANHIGEIWTLSEIARPTHGTITNIGKGHLGLFGSIEGVARAKSELIDFIQQNAGTAILNGDDPHLKPLQKLVSSRITFGMSKSCDVRAIEILPQELGRYGFEIEDQSIVLQVPGRHMIWAALAAYAVGKSLDIPATAIAEALNGFKPFKQRMEIERIGDVILINDAYNANPSSVLAALQTLKDLPNLKRRIAVLGDMLELGEYSVQEHEAIGQTAPKMGIDMLLGFGPSACHAVEAFKTQGAEAVHFEDQDDLTEHLLSILQTGDGVLVKGSRGMRMEQVVEAIKNGFTNTG